MKYNINFNTGVMKLYNLKILEANVTIKLGFFGNFGVAVGLSHLGSIPELSISTGPLF